MSCWLANADTSDAPAQPVADTVIDHGAEALGALTDFLTEISRELLATASAPATFHIAKSRYSSTDGSCAGPRPRRERGRGLIHGARVSCSPFGGAMRRVYSRLGQHAQSPVDALSDISTSEGSDTEAAMEASGARGARRATASVSTLAGSASHRR